MRFVRYSAVAFVCAALVASASCKNEDDDNGGGGGGGGGGGNPFLEYSSTFDNVTTGMPFTITVQLNDADGNADTASTDTVTLSLENNPGFNIVHQGGNSDRMLDLIDADTGTMLKILSSDEGDNEATGMVYRAGSNEIFAVERSNDQVYSIDPATGVYTTIGSSTLGGTVRGLAFNGMGEMIGARAYSDELFTISTVDGTETLRTAVTIAGDTIGGFTGFAHDPASGDFYAIAKLDTASGGDDKQRFLVTIQVGAGTATLVGQMNDGCSALAFDPAGNLFACTGDGGSPSESLLSINKASGAGTVVMDIDIGDDGDCITSVPARLEGTLSAAAVAGVATFNVWLSAPGAGYTIRATRAGGGTLVGTAFNVTTPPTAALVEFAAATSNADENVGTHPVTVSLSAAQPHNVFVTWDIVSGPSSASAGSDFQLGSFGTVMIPAGSTSAVIDIPIDDDASVEGNEDFTLTVVHAGLSTIGTMTTHTVTIVDND